MMDSLNSVQYQPLQQYEPPQGGERKLDRKSLSSPAHQARRALCSGAARMDVAEQLQRLGYVGKLQSCTTLQLERQPTRYRAPLAPELLTARQDASFDFRSDAER